MILLAPVGDVEWVTDPIPNIKSIPDTMQVVRLKKLKLTQLDVGEGGGLVTRVKFLRNKKFTFCMIDIELPAASTPPKYA